MAPAVAVIVAVGVVASLVIAGLCVPTLAATPLFSTQVAHAEWGIAPVGGTTNECLMGSGMVQRTVSTAGVNAYQYTQSVQAAVVAVARDTSIGGDLPSVFASWTTDADDPGLVTIVVCRHWRDTEPVTGAHARRSGVVRMCNNAPGTGILCRPLRALGMRRLSRAATFTTPYVTGCTNFSTTCACSDPSPDLDSTCDPPACPGNCNGNGACNDGTGQCECDLGWFGRGCEATCNRVSPLNGEVCSGHGSCRSSSASSTCACDAPFSGPLCDQCADADAYAPHLDCSLTCPSDPVLGVCGGSWRGTCDSTLGCQCHPGSGLDPRTGCMACLPNMVVDADRITYLNPEYHEWDGVFTNDPFCLPRGLCTTTKLAAMGLTQGDEPVEACNAEAFHSALVPCDMVAEDGDNPTECTPGVGMQQCNNHGVCIATSDVKRVLTPQLSTHAIGNGCMMVLTTDKRIVITRRDPSASSEPSCAWAVGSWSAPSLLNDPTVEPLDIGAMSGNDYFAIRTTDGRLWGIYLGDPTKPAFEIPIAGSPGGAIVDWISANFNAYVVMSDNKVYTVSLTTTSSVVTHMGTVAPSLVPTRIFGGSYASVATATGDWWVIRTNTYRAIPSWDDVPYFIPLSSFQGRTAVGMTWDQNTAYAVMSDGRLFRWEPWVTPSLWADYLNKPTWSNLMAPYLVFSYSSSPLENGSPYATLRGPTTSDSRSVSDVIAAVGDGFDTFVDVASVYNKYLSFVTDDGVLHWYATGDATLHTYTLADEYAHLAPLGVLPLAERYYAAYVDVGNVAGNSRTISQRYGATLGISPVSGVVSNALVPSCACDEGWTGRFCTVRRDCSGVVDGVACVSGLTPGANPDLNLVTMAPYTSVTDTTTAAGDAVRAISLEPGLAVRAVSTRVHHLAQREVFLDPVGGFTQVTGVTHVNARLYSPARAEYLCYRAHSSGRVVHTKDFSSLRPTDFAAVAHAINTPAAEGEPVPPDSLFWARDREEEDGTWRYVGLDSAWNVVKTYTEMSPTSAGNLVCAFDRASHLDAAPDLDVLATCRIPAWFCAVWKAASHLSNCVR